jgi:ABC-type sugar transport system ATPase subunit
VNIVEPLGDRMDVYLTSSGGQKFIANVDPHNIFKPEQQVTMYIDSDRIHIFEPGDTGRNIASYPPLARE